MTFLVRTLKARNSSNSSSAESCFFTEQSLCFPSRSTERRIWFCSTGESTYHVHGFFLLCLPVRETETIMSGRESSWDTRKAFQMSLSQKARLYCLIHKLYCKIRGFKMMQFLVSCAGSIVLKNKYNYLKNILDKDKAASVNQLISLKANHSLVCIPQRAFIMLYELFFFKCCL